MPSGPTLGGPNTGGTIGGALLGCPGENITKLGTILPLCYQRGQMLSQGQTPQK